MCGYIIIELTISKENSKASKGKIQILYEGNQMTFDFSAATLIQEDNKAIL
jgi:hypothetical protein